MADLCKVFHFLRCVYSYLPELYGYCVVIVWCERLISHRLHKLTKEKNLNFSEENDLEFSWENELEFSKEKEFVTFFNFF